MPKSRPHTLLCTVGTSLFYPNLSGLTRESQSDPALAALAQAYAAKNWREVADRLHHVTPTERLCGAEINSVTELLTDGLIEKARLHLLFSDTDDGRAIAQVLQAYFETDGWQVQTHCVADLRDNDPQAFRTRGLRNLAKVLGERMYEAGGKADFCAINATGGYKAQIAIAVLMGQALGIPVYYKHERFDAIIPFPPMPVSLDSSLWEGASGMFMVLGKVDACEPYERFREEWDERFETLIDRVQIDGEDYLELSTTGQIFHETFRARFRKIKDTRLPRPATQREKQQSNLAKHGYGQAEAPISHFMQKLTDERPYVRFCHTTYWNPDLPESTRFRLSSDGVQGIYSNGSWCVKFAVLTTTDDRNELPGVVADLNDWLHDWLLSTPRI